MFISLPTYLSTQPKKKNTQSKVITQMVVKSSFKSKSFHTNKFN